ncbi:MAG: toxin-antitoxin system HicB family antitoxin [Candidatus Promineifilaceae bacterium]
MGTITVRLSNEAHQRIKELASSRNISLNKLYEEFTVMALAEFDAENRFTALASKGNKQRGKELLKKLQEYYGDANGRSS